MPRLVLFRHSKAAQHSGGGDAQRPLTERGREDAARIGRWLAAQAITPDVALVSDARRTRETWQLASAELAGAPEAKLDPALYLAEPATLLREIRRAPPAGTLMVVGHNPGLAELAVDLVGSGPPEAVGRLIENFPTSALAVIDFEGRWSELGERSGRLARYVTPRILREGAEI